jgi:dolichol-phosphate mannosyltransferase
MQTDRPESFKISVVVPAFNEAANVGPLSAALGAALARYPDHEIVFVDDGSTDGTLSILRELRRKNPRIRYVSFSRNFGHQSALRAGLDTAAGDCVVTMDADGQHPTETLHAMIERWRAGAEIVTAVREGGGNAGLFKRATSRGFYRFMNAVADVRLIEGGADFRLLDRVAVDVLRSLPESNLFVRGMVGWIGFRQEVVPYAEAGRAAGVSKYSVGRMIALGLNGITSFSIRPLRLATLVGTMLAVFSLLYGLYALYVFFFTQHTVPGWTSIMASILFCGGMQMLLLGIFGEYLGRLYIESKRRPFYVVRDRSD